MSQSKNGSTQTIVPFPSNVGKRGRMLKDGSASEGKFVKPRKAQPAANPVLTPEQVAQLAAKAAQPLGWENLPAWLQDLANTEGWQTHERADAIKLCAIRFVLMENAPRQTLAGVANWWTENITCGYKVMGKMLYRWNKARLSQQ